MNYLKNEAVLVTGSTGLVGSNLIARLLEEGAKIRATFHKKPPIVTDERIEYVYADLTRKEDCKRIVSEQRYIFMCAAITASAADTQANPMKYVNSNLLMYTQMLEAAYNANVAKFLWLSSTTAYPPSGDKPVKEDELFSGAPYEKYYFVGWTHRFIETLSEMYGKKLTNPMTTIVLRPTSVYGINDNFDSVNSHVVPALIRKVVERQNPIEVWGTGEDTRDFIYVDDLVQSIILAMKKINQYTTINIGLGKGFSIKELLQTILQLDGYTEADITFDSLKPSMIPIRLVDTTKAKALLNFTANQNIKEGLKKTILWYKAKRQAEKNE